MERAKVVKAEWFWSSIQIEACADEASYLYNESRQTEEFSTSIGTPSSFTSPTGCFSDDERTPTSGTPGSASRRKRKRLLDLIPLVVHKKKIQCVELFPLILVINFML